VRLVLVSGILLVLDLFLAPWYLQTFLIANVEFTRTALEPPSGLLAVLAWLLTMALLVEVVLSRMATEGLPDLQVPWVRIQLLQAGATFVLVLVKFIATAGHYGWGAWLGLLLAAAFTYGVWAAAGQPRPADWRRVS
jgi:hypothetical protein